MLQNRDTGAFAAVSVLQHPPLSPSRRQLHVGTFTRASGWEEWDGRTGGRRGGLVVRSSPHACVRVARVGKERWVR